jgi:sugar phosphate isomerase/epimerase
MTWPLSVLTSSLPGSFEDVVPQLTALGFTHLDVPAMVDRPAAHLELLADSGLTVSCAALGRGLPEGHALDVPGVEIRRRTVALLERHIADAALLGATHAYLVPGRDGSREGLLRFAEACALLADFAAQRMIRLCIEHLPGLALERADATLDWLQALGHDNLFLLLDLGHCLLTNEIPAQVIRTAGARLGYVHLDDNDGVRDLHWPLLHGRLTESMLSDALAALRDAGYRGALAFELKPENCRTSAGLSEGQALLGRLMNGD